MNSIENALICFLFFLCTTFNSVLFSQTVMTCGTESASGGQYSSLCTLNPPPNTDNGNKYFIPNHPDAPELIVKVNLWVITHSFLYDGSQAPVTHFTSDPTDTDFLAQHNYLKQLIPQANERVWDNEGLLETCVDGSMPNPIPMIDTRIRFVLNKKPDGSDAIFYQDDFLSATTLSSGNAFHNFVLPYPEHENVVNILFLQDANSGADGIAMDGSDQDIAHIVINNGYQRYLDNQYVLEAQNLVHEFIHIMGHGHTDSENQEMLYEYSCSYDNNPFFSPLNHAMSPRGANQTFLSHLAIGQIRRMLLTTWRSKYLQFVPQDNSVIEITGYETIDPAFYWTGDIQVNAGATLEITGDLFLSEDSRIFVKRGGKVIVDGGRITSCNPDVRWEGILVEGFGRNADFGSHKQLDHPSEPADAGDAGTVWLKNAAILENANNAISTANWHLSPAKKYFGGLIWTESETTFQNCGRAVEIMKFGTQQKPDKSRFLNTNFIDCNKGVSNWASDGVRFEGCNFLNLDDSAIFAYDAQIFVENGNHFEDCFHGVNLFGTHVDDYELRIGNIAQDPNTFIGNLGFNIQAFSIMNNSPLVIENNEIINAFNNGDVGAKTGIFVFGNSYYELRNNFVGTSRFGIRVLSSGNELVNRIWLNELERPLNCIYIEGSNNTLQITSNCLKFYANSNIEITENGTLAQDQGSILEEAGNCFDNFPGFDNDLVNDNENFTLKYYVAEGLDPEDCRIPMQEDSPNIELPIALADNTGYENCGIMGEEPPPAIVDCGVGQSELEILQLISDKELLLQNTLPGSAEHETLRLCLNQQLMHLYRFYLSQEEHQSAFNYFSNRSSFEDKAKAFSALLEMDNLLEARTYLNSIPTVSAEQDNFVYAQHIHLNFLNDPTAYVIDPVEEDELVNRALERSPYSAYAASVLALVTGRVLEIPVAEPKARLAPPSLEAEFQEPGIFPNPVQYGQFKINTSEPWTQIRIMDSQGIVHIKRQLLGKEELVQAHNWPSGLYFCIFSDESGQQKTQKLIITK